MPKSKSSVQYCVSFPIEISEALKSIAQKRGVGVNFVIRESVYEFVNRNGYKIRAINPTHGERTDLHYATDDELKALGERLKKARASARAKKKEQS